MGLRREILAPAMIVGAAIGACTSFAASDDDSIADSGSDANANADEAAVDAANVSDTSSAVDSPTTADDGSSETDANDPDAGDPLCTSTENLVGNADLLGLENDDNQPSRVDAFPYVRSGGGAVRIARCIRIYLSVATSAGPVRVGVYEDSANLPVTLKAQATIQAPSDGWNVARLDHSFAVAANAALWLAVVATKTDSVTLRLDHDCSSGGLRRQHDDANGNLPAVFVAREAGIQHCRAAFYLTP